MSSTVVGARFEDASRFTPGIRVRIEGLKSKPELNGTCGTVAIPDTEEAQSLQESSRVKVKPDKTPKRPLSLKPANLTIIIESTVDWSFIDDPPFGIKECCLHSPLGDMDLCHEFSLNVLAAVSHGTGDEQPRQRFDKEQHLETMLKTAADGSQHCMYFCAFDQIGHHCVLETHGGRARLFQAFVKSRMDTNVTTGAGQGHGISRIDHSANSTTTVGYNAREWCGAVAAADWPQETAEAHKRWGGSKELTLEELEALLLLLFRLQALAHKVGEVMVQQLPAGISDEEKEWERSAQTSGSQPIGQSPVQVWTGQILENPGGFSMMPTMHLPPTPGDPTDVYTETRIISNEAYTGSAPFEFAIPGELAFQFMEAFVALTGVQLPPPVLIQVLNHFQWRSWTTQVGGKPSAIGWAILPVTMAH